MKGYIALTTILIIVPLLLLTGVNTLYDSITSLSISKMSYDSQILRANSESCLEESVYRIKRDPDLIGDITLTEDDWSCVINVVDKAGFPGSKTLTITSEDVNGMKFTVRKEIDTTTNPFKLTNL